MLLTHFSQIFNNGKNTYESGCYLNNFTKKQITFLKSKKNRVLLK